MTVSFRRTLQRTGNKMPFYNKFLIAPDGAFIQLIFVQDDEMLFAKVVSLLPLHITFLSFDLQQVTVGYHTRTYTHTHIYTRTHARARTRTHASTPFESSPLFLSDFK